MMPTKAEIEETLEVKLLELQALKDENKRLKTQSIQTNVVIPKKTALPPFINILDEKLLRKDMLSEKIKDLKVSALQNYYNEYCDIYDRCISEYMSAFDKLQSNNWIMRNGMEMTETEIEKHQKLMNEFSAKGHKKMPTKK